MGCKAWVSHPVRFMDLKICVSVPTQYASWGARFALVSAPMRLEQQYASWSARFALVSPPNMHHGVQGLLSCPTQYALWGARFASVSLPTRFIKCKICSSVPPDTLHGVQGFSVPPKTFQGARFACVSHQMRFTRN